MLAFSNSLWMLFLSRVVDGLFGGNFPIAKAVIGDIVPPRERGKQMANVGMAYVLSALLGPGLGGLLSEWGIQGPALAAATLSFLTMIITYFYLDETLPRSLLQQKKSIPDHAKAKLYPELVDASKISHTREDPLYTENSIRTILNHNQQARRLLLIWGIHTLGFTIYVSSISIFGNYRLNLSTREIGLMLSLSGVIRVIYRIFLFNPMLNKLGDQRSISLGLALFILTFLVLSFVDSRWLFIVCLVLMSIAASCTRGPLNGRISSSVGPEDQGKINGLSSSLDSFSQILGPLIGGFILGYFPPFYFGLLLTGLAVLAFIFRKV
jgi:DHA1 family tetracycline resistance protein-like MFS transporter